jgi:AraC-like DNA-binding protein
MSLDYSDTVLRILHNVAHRYAHEPLDAGQDGIVRHAFSVAGEKTALQMHAWRDYVGRSLDVSVSRAQVAGGFRGDIESWVLGDMVFMDARTDPFVQARSQARISTDNVREFVLHMAIEGIVETLTDRMPRRSAGQHVPGVLALDMGQPMHMWRPAPARVLAFFLPRAVVEAVVRDPDALHGQVIAFTSPAGRQLARQLRPLVAGLHGLPRAAAERALRAGAAAILAAFARQQRLDGRSDASERRTLRGDIDAHVQANLHRQGLTPDSILRNFAIARPTLYRLFEDEGGLAAYIRNRRLRAAANELVDAPTLAVADIASTLAFGSATDFTRAFRRAYGLAPSEFRALGRGMLRV